MISRLERRLGVSLFERTSRRVALTPAGVVFLSESREALAAVDRAATRTQRSTQITKLVVAVRSGTGSAALSVLLDVYRRPGEAAPVELLFTERQAPWTGCRRRWQQCR